MSLAAILAPTLGAELAEPAAAEPCSIVPSLADLVTASGYGLGLWWALGGPDWAAVLSILADELDGRIARAVGCESERGSALDWGADVALTPLVLLRLGRALEHEEAALVAAPAVLFLQAHLRGAGWRPPLGSVRAVATLATLALEHGGGRKGARLTP